MQIIVRGKNVEVTPALREYVDEKIGRLTRYFDNLREAIVLMSVEKGRHVVEVTVYLNENGIILRGEEASNDMYASLDLVLEKLERQIEKYKTRISRIVLPKAKQNGEQREEIDNGKVVKTKRFAVKPMDTEEAVMQMNLLGHDFFVFFNSDSEEVNVVYKRKDGNYGLIEPEF